MITDIARCYLCLGVMMLLSVRAILAAEWPGANDDGRYYWEQCAFLDSDDFSNLFQVALYYGQKFELTYAEDILYCGVRLYDASDGEVLLSQAFTTPQQGGLSSQPDYNLLMAARWRLWGDDGSYSYHLHRTPIAEDDLENGVWSASGRTRNQTALNTWLSTTKFRTRTGALLDHGDLADSPVQWQLRHGTKRRKRRFWLP